MKKAIVEANVRINEEVREIIEEYEGPFSDIIKENYRISKEENLPLCQDTGMVEFFVFLGHTIELEEPIEQTLNRAVEEVYREYPFRFSVVSDPLFDRINTETNTPPLFISFKLRERGLRSDFL